jgi:hypothetical protein
MSLIRQGDVLLIPVTEIPSGTKRVKRDAGRVVLAYGEVTGHAHAIVHPDVTLVTSQQADELRTWMKVTAPESVELLHEEHDTLLVPPGNYEVRRQREYAPEAPVWVAD